MKQIAFYWMPVLFNCLLAAGSCSQNQTAKPVQAERIFVGSTPCDSLVKALLQIPSASVTEFIKWELRLGNGDGGPFRLSVLYGESQPNTNGFKGGGTKIELTGNYTVTRGTSANPRLRAYSLKAEQLVSPLWMVEMDSNVLHFADAGKKLLVGNGGWGYVLNRVKE